MQLVKLFRVRIWSHIIVASATQIFDASWRDIHKLKSLLSLGHERVEGYTNPSRKGNPNKSSHCRLFCAYFLSWWQIHEFYSCRALATAFRPRLFRLFSMARFRSQEIQLSRRALVSTKLDISHRERPSNRHLLTEICSQKFRAKNHIRAYFPKLAPQSVWLCMRHAKKIAKRLHSPVSISMSTDRVCMFIMFHKEFEENPCLKHAPSNLKGYVHTTKHCKVLGIVPRFWQLLLCPILWFVRGVPPPEILWHRAMNKIGARTSHQK